jgi:hypothetical protein
MLIIETAFGDGEPIFAVATAPNLESPIVNHFLDVDLFYEPTGAIAEFIGDYPGQKVTGIVGAYI